MMANRKEAAAACAKARGNRGGDGMCGRVRESSKMAAVQRRVKRMKKGGKQGDDGKEQESSGGMRKSQGRPGERKQRNAGV